MKEAQKLLSKVLGLISKQEYRSVKLHGVMCSRADLEMIQMYCEHVIRGEKLSRYIIFENVKPVLDKAGIDYKS